MVKQQIFEEQGMNGLSPRTWQLSKILFPNEAERAGEILLQQCGTNLPSCQDKNAHELERFRFAALKISEGKLDRLQKAVDQAKRDWRDELMWAGFANSLTAHEEWAREILGE